MGSLMQVDSSTTVLIPMRLNAFQNYASDRFEVFFNAYLAPIPSLQSFDVNQLSKSNDIYESVRNPPYVARVDRSRVIPEREGIYLHWELPKYYKTATARSNTAAGSGSTTGLRANSSLPDVPDRYIIVRTVTGGDAENAGLWSSGRDDPLSEMESSGFESPNLPLQTVDVFVVNASLIRQPEDLISTVSEGGFIKNVYEDAEITSSPYIDVGSPSSDPTYARLGKTTSLDAWEPPSVSAKRAYPLTVHSTGNPFFADFQPHNSSVFSIFDPLISSTAGTNGPLILRKGKVSYHMVGWHSNEGDDPVTIPSGSSFDDVMKACRFDLDTTSLDITSLASVVNARSICHGSFFNINWSTCDIFLPIWSAGDPIQANISQSLPFAVGTNALDALFGWVDAANSPDSDLQDVKALLRKLQSWVLDVNDNLDSQLQAQDLLSSNNFRSTSNGILLQFEVSQASGAGKPVLPTLENMADVERVNALERLVNAGQRELDFRRQQLFDLWWLLDQNQEGTNIQTLTNLVSSIKARITDLTVAIEVDTWSNSSVGEYDFAVPVRTVPDDAFYLQRDPTVLIAGACSNWPNIQNSATKVRVDGQDSLVQWLNAANPGPKWTWDATEPYPSSYPLEMLWGSITSQPLQSFVDRTLAPAMLRVLSESALNCPDVGFTTGEPNSSSVVPSVYFGVADRLSNDPQWNAWCPLYVDWEIEYYDIPFENWTFEPYGTESRWGYTINNTLDLTTFQGSARLLSGRAPIVPQTAASLSNVLQQVFSRMNPDVLETIIPDSDREAFLTQINQLDYLSTNMSGLTDQLLGRQQGTHMLPFIIDNAASDKTAVVSQAAIAKGATIGLVESDFQAMFDAAGTVTTQNPAITGQAVVPAVAPMIHGQFRFTKFNIVDRWGQIVRGIKQDTYLPIGKAVALLPDYYYLYPTALYPALGEQYSVASTGATATTAKTVLPRPDSHNSFVQIPPCLNQPARVNFDFMINVENIVGEIDWRVAQSHENPVMLYIVFNAADESLQLFTYQGYFICEILTVSGTLASRPFPSNEALCTNPNGIVQSFLTQLRDATYVRNLYQNIEATIANVQSVSEHTAETMQAIMGRPLALVAFGTAIELANIPASAAWTFPVPKDSPSIYRLEQNLQIKLGDHDNVFDGLYGIFNATGPTPAVDFSIMYSYADPSNLIQPLQTQPFWINPLFDNSSTNNMPYPANIFAALVDPFTPVHAYTALLPIKELSIPKWAIARGLSQISSFFKVGPIVTASDVPAADSSAYVGSNLSTTSTLPADIGTIAMPALGYADWAWMQPTVDPTTQQTQYNICNVDLQPAGPQYQEGPHTITEGYLLMRQPFGPPDPPESPF